MSLEASVYTPNETLIPRDELVRAAADAGWVLSAVHDIFEPARFGTVSGGMLTDGDYFYGWQASDPHAMEYAQALVARQVEQLERWAQEDPERELGAAFIHTQPYQHDNSPSQDEELANEMGSECIAVFQAAKLEYIVDLHANNDNFLLVLARLICRMRGGFWLDHLGGQWGVELT